MRAPLHGAKPYVRVLQTGQPDLFRTGLEVFLIVDGIDEATLQLLRTHGFDQELCSRWQALLRELPGVERFNCLKAGVEPLGSGEIRLLPSSDSIERRRLTEVGLQAFARGEVGAVVLAGGMATRFGGVVKALAPVVESQTFLDFKLSDVRSCSERARRTLPVFLMTSFGSDALLHQAARQFRNSGMNVQTFCQFISLRLTEDGALFRTQDGSLSPYAPGHGDLPAALRKSGLLDAFMSNGGRYLCVSNVDNLTATLDPAIVGAHIECGAAVTVEVVKKACGDQGGAPARVGGVPQIVETFRFPNEFDQDAIPVFNTNTMTMTASALDQDFALSWFLVRKTVEGRTAIQFERLIGELTAYLPTQFLQVERTGLDSRFQPVKSPEELAQRIPEILKALQARNSMQALPIDACVDEVGSARGGSPCSDET